MTENIYLKAVNALQKGETRSFGEISELAGKPNAPRAAGRVLTSCPVTSKDAWHRAVTTRGSLSIDPERARVQLERLRKENARPREEESVAAWAKRVRTPYIGNYRHGVFVESGHPRLAKFDPLYVERLASEVAGVARGFMHFDDLELRRRDERVEKKPVQKSKRKPARR
jgi:alkylated DNA nucleotide flippase Atl1